MKVFLMESSIFMLVALLCYGVFFRRSKYFSFNRIYLISSLLVAIILPFVSVSTLNSAFQLTGGSGGYASLSMPLVPWSPRFTSQTVALKEAMVWDVLDFPWEYLMYLGSALMLSRYIISLVRLKKTIRKGQIIHKEDYQLVLLKEKMVPYSFMDFIFVNEKAYHHNEIDPAILLHEKQHIRLGHSYDILLMEFILILMYFHPLVWIYRKLIRLNHEYQVDETLLMDGVSAKHYGNLLMGYQTSTAQLFECNFSFINTRKRFMMMGNQKDRKWHFSTKLFAAILILGIATSSLLMGNRESGYYSGSEQAYRVYLDLSHGGWDKGQEHENQNELFILSAIGEELRKIHTDIEIIYSRTANENPPLWERLEQAHELEVDLMLCMHVGSPESGLEVVYNGTGDFSETSREAAQLFYHSNLGFQVKNTLRDSNDYYVLKRSKVPTVMLSIGNLKNEEDFNLLKSEDSRQLLAENILNVLVNLAKD